MNRDDWKFSPGAIPEIFPTTVPVEPMIVRRVDCLSDHSDVMIRKFLFASSSIEYCESGLHGTNVE